MSVASSEQKQWQELWQAALAEVQLMVSKGVYETGFKQSFIIEIDDTSSLLKIALGVPNFFWKNQFQQKYHPELLQIFSRLVGNNISVEYIIASKSDQKFSVEDTPLFNATIQPVAKPKGDDSFLQELKRLRLEPERSLDNFAVSSSNEMAYAAANAVAKRPGAAYNPLFIYGKVGVGKTHLMQGIGQYLLQEDLTTKIIYCSGEEFTNAIIEAIQKKTTIQFRNKYRTVKLLMIDDIQFIAGKASVQEEFFHTFNAITTAGGQVIMTSDKPPKEIDSLEDRLRSRFEGGLTVDIGKPNFELRCAILMIKINQLKLQVPSDVVQYIANNEIDARALIGKLLTLLALADQYKQPITLDFAQKHIQLEESTDESIALTPEVIIETVCNYYNQPLPAVIGPSRLQYLVTPRHMAMFLLKEQLRLNLVDIGKRFNGRDHTTVMHGIEKVEQRIKADTLTQRELFHIKKQLQITN